MKRIFAAWICLILLLSIGCVASQDGPKPLAAEQTDPPAPVVQAPPQETEAPVETDAPAETVAPAETEAPVETEAPTSEPYQPDLSLLPQLFNTYDDMSFDEKTKEMFVYDWDFDGTEESIVVTLNWEENTTTVQDGKRSITLDNGAALWNVILIDLDPSTPYVNVVLSIDEASDDYITFALHPEGDEIVASDGKYMACSLNEQTGMLIGDETCDLLGTDTGSRIYGGEDLAPETEWLDYWTPDEDDLKNNRESLIEGGVLIHASRDVPCVIDGDPDVIPEGSYVYRVRFCDTRDSIEVCLEDGRIAEIVFDNAGEDEEYTWPYTIDGIDQEQYFDNLFFAD